MPGRRKGKLDEPLELKLAKGTFRADRHGKLENMPQGQPLRRDTPAPEELTSEIERKTWTQIVALLVPKGLATDLDVPAIIRYCEDVHLAKLCREDIDKRGIVIDGKSNMSLLRLDQAKKRILAFEKRFGMSPLDRTGMDIHKELDVPDDQATGTQSRKRC